MLWFPPPSHSADVPLWFIGGGLLLVVGLPLIELLVGLKAVVAALFLIVVAAIVLALVNPEVAKDFLNAVPSLFKGTSKGSPTPSSS